MTSAMPLPRRAVVVAAVAAAVVVGLSTTGEAAPLTDVGEARAGETAREATSWSPDPLIDGLADLSSQHALPLTSTGLTAEAVDVRAAADDSPAARSVASHDVPGVCEPLEADGLWGRGGEGATGGGHGGPASMGHRALAVALGTLTLVTLGAAMRVRSRALGECRRLVGS